VATQLIGDLEETFSNLRANHIKLKLEKCVFGVLAKKLLGFIVSEHGIEANPEKISVPRSVTSYPALGNEVCRYIIS
jgi:hypothetical protein